MGTILIALALFVMVVALVALPLLDPKTPAVEPLSPREALETEREAAVRSIRELDFDYRTHKLTEQDYKTLRENLVQRGAHILRELDQLKPAEGSGVAEDVDAEIEARVATLRQAPGPADSVAAPFCPACGKKVKPEDLFCASCGARLAKIAEKRQPTRG